MQRYSCFLLLLTWASYHFSAIHFCWCNWFCCCNSFYALSGVDYLFSALPPPPTPPPPRPTPLNHKLFMRNNCIYLFSRKLSIGCHSCKIVKITWQWQILYISEVLRKILNRGFRKTPIPTKTKDTHTYPLLHPYILAKSFNPPHV